MAFTKTTGREDHYCIFLDSDEKEGGVNDEYIDRSCMMMALLMRWLRFSTVCECSFKGGLRCL